MWIKAEVGNHYGIFEVIGVELYKESDDSFIIYGYLPRPVPEIPVGIDKPLKDFMTHTDFVKIYEFNTEEGAKEEIGRIQAFLNEGAKGVYEVRPLKAA